MEYNKEVLEIYKMFFKVTRITRFNKNFIEYDHKIGYNRKHLSTCSDYNRYVKIYRLLYGI